MYRRNERTRLTRVLSLVLAVVFTLSFTGLGRVFATDALVGESPVEGSVQAPTEPTPEEAVPEAEPEAEAPREEPKAEKPVADPKPEAEEAEVEEGDEKVGKEKKEKDDEDEEQESEPPYDPGGYETVEGNPAIGDDCVKFYGAGTYEVEIDGVMVTITVSIEDSEDGEFLSWTSSEPVETVIVKGGPDANIYSYGGAMSGSGLHAPLNRGNDEAWPDVSWVGFCYDDIGGGGGGEEPAGAVHVYKYHDMNGNGVQDEGEGPLAGWSFVLTTMEDVEIGTETTGEDGMAHFVGLEDGTYMVTEILEEDWEVTTGSLSQTVEIVDGEPVDVVFGNRMVDVEKMWTKTFSLHIEGDINVAVEGYGVAFELDGEAEERMLVGTMPHFFLNMDVPEGSVISGWRFFAMVDGAHVWLTAPGGEETIMADTLNEMMFTPGEICGVKYIDVDGDSAGPGDVDDDFGAGVTLILDGPGVMDYEVMTDAEGNYCFDGLLPGTYMVSEAGMPDWSVVYPEMWPAQVMLSLGEMSAMLDIVNQPPLAAVDVQKTVNVATAEPGDMVVWTITVTNTGAVSIGSFELMDELLGIDETVMFNLAPGESWEMDYEYMVPMDAMDGTLTNCVDILAYPEVGPPIPDEDCASFEVVVPGLPMVDIEKVADVETVLPGGTIVYTLTFTNTGDADAVDFTIIDDYDETMVTVTDPAGAVDAGGVLTWEIAGPLAPGESVSVPYTVVADADLEAGAVIANTVTIPEFETSDSETVIVGAEQLPMVDIMKVADVETVLPGGEIVYTLTFTNTSAVPATDFTIIDDYDETVVTVTDPAGAVDAGGMLTWDIAGPLAPGASVSVMYTVLADPLLEPGTVIINTVTIPEFGASDSDIVIVGSDVVPSEIIISKTANRGTVEPGGFITYTISYTNTGDVEVSGFTIVDDYPEQYVTVTDPNGGVVAGGMVTWAVDVPLAPGATRSFNYLVQAGANVPAGTDIVNVATVVEYDNSDSATVEVTGIEFLPFTETTTTSPFLPFTGNELLATLLAVMMAAMLGFALRVAGRQIV